MFFLLCYLKRVFLKPSLARLPSSPTPGLLIDHYHGMKIFAFAQGVFFWKSGFVVRALSDDWYMVRIQGRAADEEGSSADEHEL